MKKRLQKNKLLSIILIVFMAINLMTPAVLASEVIEKKVETKVESKAEAKPLVILMNYQDYKFEDIDSKESKRMRKISGEDYTPELVKEMLFGENLYTEDGKQFMTVRKYFDEVSGGCYYFNGDVVGPYTASHDAAYYGNNDGGSDQDTAMLLAREAVQAVAKDSNVDLSKYDVENRTGDGEFNKPDGVIDTVIVIHPGIGEEWRGGSLGKDAIWPFRIGFSWYYENNFQVEKVIDYSNIERKFDDFVLIAQDSAQDMLIHEYGHVLGLPDLYGTNESEPPVKWWSVMGGSYTGKDIVGTMPVSYGAFCREKLQNIFEKKNVENSKWANIEKEDFSKISENGIDLELQQSHDSVKGKTDVYRINLPKKETIITEPTSGDYAYYSGNKNNLRNNMKKTLDLSNYDKAKLEFKTWYDIDPYFDFATVRVNVVGSEEFEAIKGNITTDKVADYVKDEKERKERNPGQGITDKSNGWINAEFDLSKYAGKEIELKFYFWSDDNTPGEGIYIDDVKISGVVKGTKLLKEEILNPVSEEKPAESDNESNQIELGKKVEGKFTEDNYNHNYGLVLSEEKNISIAAEYKKDSGITWAIYTTSGSAIAWPGKEEVKIPTGTYDFAIYCTGENKTGNYSFTVSEKSVVPEPEDPEEKWETIFEDDAEGETTFDMKGGFTKSTGKSVNDQYYLLEWRNVEEGKIDEGLKHVYFEWPEIGYDPGLLVWYVNYRWMDENGDPNQQVAEHPAECGVGVVDADQNTVGYDYRDGNYYDDKRTDFNMHDAAFGLKRGSKLYYDWGGGTISKDKHTFMVPDFNDEKEYTKTVYSALTGLKLTNYGVKILVTDQTSDSSSAKIHIMNSKLENNPVDYSDGLNVKNIKINADSIEVQAENKGLTDNLGEEAYIGYVKKDAAGKFIEAKEELVLKDGVYKCSTNFLSTIEKGKYQINYVVLEDAKGNSRAIYNSKVNYGYGTDLSSGDIDNDNLVPDNKPVEIKKIKALDKNGAEKKEFEKGNTVLINVTLEAKKELENAVIIIEVQDKNGVPSALRYVPYNKVINEYSLGFSTYELEKGQSNVNIYVWDNLSNKTPLCETEMFKITVK